MHALNKLPAYLALEVSRDQLDDAAFAESIQVLTPRVMQWSGGDGQEDSIWLLDMHSCASYWHAQAERQGLEVLSLLRLIISKSFTRYRAALAGHPWQAVLLLAHIRQRGLEGLINYADSFGQTLYRELPWKLWWSCVDALSQHLEHSVLGKRKFNAALFQRQCSQMQRTVKRLDMSTPWQMRELSSLSMKRRFGSLLHDIWEWSYGKTIAATPTAMFAMDFPWRAHAFAEKPQIKRHLDEPLSEWNHIEPILREDLDRLCALASWQAGERVVSLEWQLVFRDLTRLNVPILFRHPHPLHLEKGFHDTALLQALYSFKSSIPGSPLDGARLDELLPAMYTVPIIGWDLIVQERLTLPSQLVGLFGDQLTSTTFNERASPERLRLLQLENKLPVPLEAYDLRADWLPEDSYALLTDGDQGGDAAFPAFQSLAVLGKKRPLFLYRQPQLWKKQGRSSLWQFSERTMAKWWQGNKEKSSEQKSLQRDYYRLTDNEQRSYWVFKDNLEQWFVHGVFA